jgi:predicted DNA-binding protein with PD1-like motif
MRSHVVEDPQQRDRTIVVVLAKGEEALGTLQDFARERGLGTCRVTAVGGFSSAILGYFDREAGTYLKIPVNEQCEVLSLVGDVADDPQGSPALHLHAVVGLRDGSTRGGHLLEGHVWPTLEVVVTESPRHLKKRFDPAVGLALLAGD